MDMNEKVERFVLMGGCPANVKEEAKVTVPCAVRAFAEVKDVELKCQGEPVVTCNSDEAPGCPGAVSKFTVSQRMLITIPIVFRAEADVGEGHVVFCPCPGECPHKDKEPEFPCMEEEHKNQTARRRI
ncbi:MAG: hypothetical protein FWC62_05070 [Firmicutes bacterium]|nr:hypothetical protein [Bacillota bacterium]